MQEKSFQNTYDPTRLKNIPLEMNFKRYLVDLGQHQDVCNYKQSGVLFRLPKMSLGDPCGYLQTLAYYKKEY